MQFHKLISTCLGIGYIGKGAGTVAAIATCIIWYFAWAGGFPPFYISLIISLGVTILGIWSSNMVAKIWGHDPARVVIDEAAGMCISLLLLPATLKYITAGLILFRFFDIVKPLYIRKTEKFPGGTGIMLDDVLAGIYTNIVLQVILLLKIF
jgi:phosphatidylglycerophosphatase A